MTAADRDALWVDLLQFDPPAADRVWDGDLGDPDAPPWYEDLGSLIHQARGPAEAEELVDEPEVVATMRRASLGAAIVALPRHRSVRSLGRVVAMKTAAAATTASMVGVAAAATTGIVATVAATVVVPAISEKVRPVVEAHVVPLESETTTTEAPVRPPLDEVCPPQGGVCADPSAPVLVDVPPAPPAAPVPVTASEPPATASETTTAEAPAATTPPVSTTETTAPPAVVEPSAAEPPPEPVVPMSAAVPADPTPGPPAGVPADPPSRSTEAAPAPVGDAETSDGADSDPVTTPRDRHVPAVLPPGLGGSRPPGH